MTQHQLFETKETKPRRPRRWLMHVVDMGNSDEQSHPHCARFVCARCGHDSDWLNCRTMSEIMRGIPCPKCNKQERSS